MTKRMKKWDKGFMCGAALICADLIRTHGQSTEVCEMIKWHVRRWDCASAGVDEHDMKELIPVWEDIEEGEKQ